MGPDLKGLLHETIRNVNHDLLSELRIAHTDGVYNSLMVRDLLGPGTGIQIFGQGAHQSERVQGNNQSQAVLSQEWISRFFQEANVKALHADIQVRHIL